MRHDEQVLAALLVPELRWDPGHGFAYLRDAIDDAIEAEVGGFLITGGPRDEVAALTRELHRRSHMPLLIAADVEAGAGAQFSGLTGLPPAGALGALRDSEVVRRAARLTARELRSVGINWALTPVADLDVHPANPFLGARAFGADAQRVAEWVVEWVDTCQAEGVLAGVKHFPGIGRALADPALTAVHIDELPRVLWAEDMLPFRAATDAGVATVLVANVVFPRLDADGAPASRSRPLLSELLRNELHFDGLIVSDAISQTAARFGTDEPTAALESVQAGCDLLLATSDLGGVLDRLGRALEAGELDIDAIELSRARRAFRANWAKPTSRPEREPTLDDVLWARQVADTLVYAVRGAIPNVGPVVDVIQVQDVAVAPWGGSVTTVGPTVGETAAEPSPFVATLRALGLSPRLVEGPTAEGRGAVVIVLHGGAGPGSGRAGFSDAARRRVAELVAAARQQQRPSVVMMFTHPRAVGELPEAPNVVCCWSGSRAMQEAAARRL